MIPTDIELHEADLDRLISAFYARVRRDDLIGPVFNGAIEHWDVHLEKLVAFWSSVMLTSGRYKGNPMAAHIAHLAELTPAMFDRWLMLWQEVTAQMLPAELATALQNKAARIAESLKLALWFRMPAAAPERITRSARKGVQQ
ncbi:MAG: group III truncated hemoglobin [Sphingomonadaceae bacterium]|nr:group III truncated hemoglobin [Sphingomonadaceae bacterium]